MVTETACSCQLTVGLFDCPYRIWCQLDRQCDLPIQYIAFAMAEPISVLGREMSGGKISLIFGTLNQIAEQLSFQEPIEYSSVDFKIAAFGVQLAWARVGLGVGSKYYNLNRNGTGGTQQAPSQRNCSILRSFGQTRFWNTHWDLQDLINGSGAGHQDLL